MSIEPKPTRVRRSPEMARENILAAAEGLLLENGPQALKLTDVARAAGIAHATVLHHFGSIGEVQTALMERMIQGLVAQVAQAAALEGDSGSHIEAGSKILFDVFGAKGAARLAAWLELTGESRRLTTVRSAVGQVAAMRLARDGVDEERAEDFILLSVLLAMGVGLFGPSLEALMDKPAGRARELAAELLRWRVASLKGG